MKQIPYLLLLLFCMPMFGYAQLYITTQSTDTLLYSNKRMTVDFTYKGSASQTLFNDMKSADNTIVMQITKRTKNSVSGKLQLSEVVNPAMFRLFLRLHKMSFCYVNNIQIQSEMFLTVEELQKSTLYTYPIEASNTKNICEQLNTLFLEEYSYKHGAYAKYLYNGSVTMNRESIVALRKELISIDNSKN